MRTIEVTLTEDMIRLISNFRFVPFPDYVDDKEIVNWGLDLNSLYGGNFVCEDIAGILGLQDTAYPDTLCDSDGPKYPDEVYDRMMAAHLYVFENVSNIEEILHQFATQGIKVGTYTCKSNEHIWTFKN